MKLLQSVVVKQVLTEKSKNDLLKNYNMNKEQLHKECDQLRFEQKKLEKINKVHQYTAKNKFDREINNRMDKIKLIEFQIEQLHMLPLGSELIENEVQAVIEVQEGNRWSELTKRKTIVVKDDIVIEIR